MPFDLPPNYLVPSSAAPPLQPQSLEHLLSAARGPAALSVWGTAAPRSFSHAEGMLLPRARLLRTGCPSACHHPCLGPPWIPPRHSLGPSQAPGLECPHPPLSRSSPPVVAPSRPHLRYKYIRVLRFLPVSSTSRYAPQGQGLCLLGPLWCPPHPGECVAQRSSSLTACWRTEVRAKLWGLSPGPAVLKGRKQGCAAPGSGGETWGDSRGHLR